MPARITLCLILLGEQVSKMKDGVDPTLDHHRVFTVVLRSLWFLFKLFVVSYMVDGRAKDGGVVLRGKFDMFHIVVHGRRQLAGLSLEQTQECTPSHNSNLRIRDWIDPPKII